ncbi:MAG: hypothetical protein ACI30I_06215 [Parabacteroides sp.]
MRARILFWGYLICWVLLFAGAGTIEVADFGSQEETAGWFLCLVWFVWSLVVIYHDQECAEYGKYVSGRIDRYFKDI